MMFGNGYKLSLFGARDKTMRGERGSWRINQRKRVKKP
jgi:hypothetical protein